MAASIGAPCRDAGGGKQGGGVEGLQGAERGAQAGKGAFPPTVDIQQLSFVVHTAGVHCTGLCGGGRCIYYFRKFTA